MVALQLSHGHVDASLSTAEYQCVQSVLLGALPQLCRCVTVWSF